MILSRLSERSIYGTMVSMIIVQSIPGHVSLTWLHVWVLLDHLLQDLVMQVLVAPLPGQNG